MGKPKQNLFQFLGSLKLSIPLLFLIAAVAVTGTLIPQNLTNEQYHRVFSPFVFNLLDRLQIFDVYHSVFFITLLVSFRPQLDYLLLPALPCRLENCPEPFRPLAEKNLGTRFSCRIFSSPPKQKPI